MSIDKETLRIEKYRLARDESPFVVDDNFPYFLFVDEKILSEENARRRTALEKALSQPVYL